ncbi:hypothetical protein [Nostoc sp.]|uniref:hypothetical protein n=1 Tax=Nostoc sp. TaxID=1180 RepID=UPI002FF88859
MCQSTIFLIDSVALRGSKLGVASCREALTSLLTKGDAKGDSDRFHTENKP